MKRYFSSLLVFILLFSGCVSGGELSGFKEGAAESVQESVENPFIDSESITVRLSAFAKGEQKNPIYEPDLNRISGFESVDARYWRAIFYQAKNEFPLLGEQWLQHVDFYEKGFDGAADELKWRYVANNGEAPTGDAYGDGYFVESIESVPAYDQDSWLRGSFGYGPFWLLVKARSKMGKSNMLSYYLLDREGKELNPPLLSATDLLSESDVSSYYGGAELLSVSAAPYLGIVERVAFMCRSELDDCVDKRFDVLRYQDDLGEWHFMTDRSEVLARMTAEDAFEGFAQVHRFEVGDESRFYLVFTGECGGCYQTMPSYLSVNNVTGEFFIQGTDPSYTFGAFCEMNPYDVLPGNSKLMCLSNNPIISYEPELSTAYVYDLATESNQEMNVERFNMEEVSLVCEYDSCPKEWIDLGGDSYRRNWFHSESGDLFAWEIYTPR